MLHDCLKGRQTPIPCEGIGQSCALIVSQPANDPGGWVFELQARIADGLVQVRRVTLTKAFRGRARVLATCTVPGATSWEAIAYPPKGTDEAPVTGIRAGLMAQDTPFAPAFDPDFGQPGSKGWSYAITAVVAVPVGALVKEVSAVGGGGAGSCQITVPRDATTTDALAAIPIAAGERFYLPKETLEGLVGPATVTFVGTARQFVAWLE
jgi:hypothetical protein